MEGVSCLISYHIIALKLTRMCSLLHSSLPSKHSQLHGDYIRCHASLLGSCPSAQHSHFWLCCQMDWSHMVILRSRLPASGSWTRSTNMLFKNDFSRSYRWHLDLARVWNRSHFAKYVSISFCHSAPVLICIEALTFSPTRQCVF